MFDGFCLRPAVLSRVTPLLVNVGHASIAGRLMRGADWSDRSGWEIAVIFNCKQRMIWINQVWSNKNGSCEESFNTHTHTPCISIVVGTFIGIIHYSATCLTGPILQTWPYYNEYFGIKYVTHTRARTHAHTYTRTPWTVFMRIKEN